MDDAATPRTVTERVLVSERLGDVEAKVDLLQHGVQDLHVALWRLVEIEERRDRREQATLERELAERAERSSWLRSLISERTVAPLLAAIAGAIAGALGSGGGAALLLPTNQSPPDVTAPAPHGSPVGPMEP